MLQEMIIAIRGSLSDLAISDNKKDGDDEENEDIELCKLTEDDNPSWVVGTTSQILQERMERLRQKQTKLDKLTQPGWWDTANDYNERHMIYRTTESKVSAVIQPQTDNVTAAPAPTSFGELIDTLVIIPGIWQMPQGTSRAGSSHMRVDSGKPQSKKCIVCVWPEAKPDSSPIQKAKPVEPVSFYPSI